MRGQVERDRHQVGVRASGVRRLEPLVELVEVDPAVARGLAQDLGDLVPVGVRDPHHRGVGPGLEVSLHAARVVRRIALPFVATDPEFRYSDLLPTGKDETPYRLITTEGV